MHMRRKYVTHACMKAHISEHVYGEQPYMSKSKASKRQFCECGSESFCYYANVALDLPNALRMVLIFYLKNNALRQLLCFFF